MKMSYQEWLKNGWLRLCSLMGSGAARVHRAGSQSVVDAKAGSLSEAIAIAQQERLPNLDI